MLVCWFLFTFWSFLICFVLSIVFLSCLVFIFAVAYCCCLLFLLLFLVRCSVLEWKMDYEKHNQSNNGVALLLWAPCNDKEKSPPSIIANESALSGLCGIDCSRRTSRGPLALSLSLLSTLHSFLPSISIFGLGFGLGPGPGSLLEVSSPMIQPSVGRHLHH